MGTLRKKYLEAVLKQDVGFFDTDARTGDIVFSVSTDTLLVQDAISEKVLQNKNCYFSFLFWLIFPFFCIIWVENENMHFWVGVFNPLKTVPSITSSRVRLIQVRTLAKIKLTCAGGVS